MSLVRGILHLEGAAVFVGATWAYFGHLEGSWVAFAALFLLPDLSMIGYLRDTRLGALTYNLVHNEALPLGIIAAGLLASADAVTGLGLILLAHVGLDRAVGYGLKSPTSFKETHLQRLG